MRESGLLILDVTGVREEWPDMVDMGATLLYRAARIISFSDFYVNINRT